MLKIFFDNELLEFDDEDLECMYVDEGLEGIVYKHGKDALKIYKDICYKYRLTEDDCIKLGTISTKRVLLPEKIIYGTDKKTFMGYSTPLVYKSPKEKIVYMRTLSFINELDFIRDDIRKLAYNGVRIYDWHNDNLLYTSDAGKVFIGDPGGLIVNGDVSGYRAFNANVFHLNRFVKEEIFDLANLSEKRVSRLDREFDDYEYIGEQMREVVRENETIKQFVKRITN